MALCTRRGPHRIRSVIDYLFVISSAQIQQDGARKDQTQCSRLRGAQFRIIDRMAGSKGIRCCREAEVSVAKLPVIIISPRIRVGQIWAPREGKFTESVTFQLYVNPAVIVKEALVAAEIMTASTAR